jgi:hypothetical protein
VPLPPPPAENGTQERSDKPRGTGGVCLHLVFVGLVAAATVMMFSIASVSLLYCKGPITRSRIGSTSLPYNDPHAGAISAEPSPPILDSPKVLSAAAQIPSIDETTELTGAKPSIEPPAYRRDVSATPSETPDTFAVWNPSGSDTIRPTEADGSGPLAREPLRTAEASVTPANPLQGNLIWDEKGSAQKVQNKRVYRHPATPDAALQTRVQKECGPIIFPALRRHCIASFGVPHPSPALSPPATRIRGGINADSGGSRPRIRDDVAHHSDLISLGVPR